MNLEFESIEPPKRKIATPFRDLRLFKILRWNVSSDEMPTYGRDHKETSSLDDADVVSSKFRDSDDHMIVLDIDVPAALVPSSTPGHSHLYIESRMPWDVYQDLLNALVSAGVVEPGYVKASERRGFTCVRLPWVTKES